MVVAVKSPEDQPLQYDPVYKIGERDSRVTYTVPARSDYEALQIIATLTGRYVENFRILQWPSRA